MANVTNMRTKACAGQLWLLLMLSTSCLFLLPPELGGAMGGAHAQSDKNEQGQPRLAVPTMAASPDHHMLSNVIEVVLATLESKLRRVENLDRAVQQLMRRLETLDKRMATHHTNLDTKLHSVDKAERERFDVVVRKLDALTDKFDSVCEEEDVEDILALPSFRRTQFASSPTPMNDGRPGFASPRRSLDDDKEEEEKRTDMKETLSGMDRRLAFHINIVSESLGKMASQMEEVHDAVVVNPPVPPPSPRVKVARMVGPLSASSLAAAAAGARRSGTGLFHGPAKRKAAFSKNKVDKLITSIEPLAGVVNEIHDDTGHMQEILSDTKTSLDEVLVPQSEKLLVELKRQEQSLSAVYNNLDEKATEMLQQMEQINRKLSTPGPIRAQPRSNKASSWFFPEEDAPLVTNAADADADARDADDLAISGSALAFISIGGSDSDSPGEDRNTSGNAVLVDEIIKTRTRPSVIFPSVENKPIVVNTSFTYDSGRNLNGITGYSCADLNQKGLQDNGVYYLQLGGTRYWYLKVYCDMQASSGGWTVIQRRDDYGEPRESFNRDWEDYKYGFGDPSREFWLGNENIYVLTRANDYTLRIELEDFQGHKRYAHYDMFRLGSEKENYRLEIGGYSGNAGDALNDPWYGSNLRPFSTFDRDNDRSSLNCASMLKGGWWWKSCGRGLNGVYFPDPLDLTARQGIVWFRWKGWDYSLKRSKMLIRPKRKTSEESKSKPAEGGQVHSNNSSNSNHKRKKDLVS